MADPKNFKYRHGLSSAGAYQVSGIPYLSGSDAVIAANSGTPWEVSFPFVTQWVIVENTGANPLRIGFSVNGVKGLSTISGSAGRHATLETNYFVLAPSSSAQNRDLSRVKLDVRVKDLYLMGNLAATTTAQIAAGLTTVDVAELTGTRTNWSASSGVG
jgi:hypothetical protein|tara:strand:+ start:791 stop:1267 length:477 start_codon:yes stop_codon:yes gene_type:complete